MDPDREAQDLRKAIKCFTDRTAPDLDDPSPRCSRHGDCRYSHAEIVLNAAVRDLARLEGENVDLIEEAAKLCDYEASNRDVKGICESMAGTLKERAIAEVCTNLAKQIRELRKKPVEKKASLGELVDIVEAAAQLVEDDDLRRKVGSGEPAFLGFQGRARMQKFAPDLKQAAAVLRAVVEFQKNPHSMVALGEFLRSLP